MVQKIRVRLAAIVQDSCVALRLFNVRGRTVIGSLERLISGIRNFVSLLFLSFLDRHTRPVIAVQGLGA